MNNKRLYKSVTNKKIAGVCGGFAEYFNMDPSIVRLIFVGLCLVWGGGLWIYIIATLVMTDNPDELIQRAASAARPDTPSDGGYKPSDAQPVNRKDNPFDANGANDAPVIDAEYTEIKE